MKSLNLTEWSLKHKNLVYFFIALIYIAGFFSYFRLGRMEDPDFVIREMIVSVAWPGASAREMEDQVIDKIEKRLQDTPGLDQVRSYSVPGQGVIYVTLKDTVDEKDIRPTWLEVRNMVNDIKSTLPEGVIGPAYNDRYDDVFGCIYAVTADGFSYEEMREQAERIRRILLGIPNVKKVELVGVQPEKIYIEMENSKLAQLGIDPNVIIAAVKAQGAMTPSGMLETTSDNVYVRVSGMFEDVEGLRNLPIQVNGQTFRLADVAQVRRGYVDPMEPKMYFNGQPTIGISLSMEKGGNILTLGSNLEKIQQQIKHDLPLGLEISQVSNQPKVVEASINEFIKSLLEAVVIVLVVSFFSLGVRSGIVVALCIPLVLAGIFACMKIGNIDLHKVSLGSLIMALGLLVDDAIIAVEMMTVKLEQGWERFEAACYAYRITAFPMLTGTLITCAGFIPIGFSKGAAAEFTSSLFPVISISLLISWLVSVMVTPLLGYHFIRPKLTAEKHDPYDTKFYRTFRMALVWCLNHRKLVMGITIVSFAGSIFLMGLVKQEFFPPSVRPELIVEMTLPEGASMQATDKTAKTFADHLANDPDIENYSYYVGKGAPRFVLTLDPRLPATNYAEFIVVAKTLEGRERLQQKINSVLADQQFANIRAHVNLIQTGPPSSYPVMLRVSGYDHEEVRTLAGKVAEEMKTNPQFKDVNFDWNEKSKIMHLKVDQDKARMLGLSSQSLAQTLQAQLSGASIAELYQKDKTVGIVFRLDANDRNDMSKIKDMPVHLGNGRFVPLSQIAEIQYDAEEGLIWRHNLKPAITVRADVQGNVTGNDATLAVYNSLASLRAQLPPGYSIDLAGSAENSQKSMNFLLQPIPVMVLIIMVLLMLQLQKVSLMLITLLTAPLGIIGVALTMLLTMRPMGFVAELGILALSGMIIRNSVILIDQIEQHIAAGESKWDAIIDSTILRFRPIMLTAAAAVLGMLPLMPSTFWGPMAVAIGGGLMGATVMTLLVLPTMYAVWFKVKPETKD